MEHHEGFVKGARGFQVYYQGWLPEGEPKAVLLIAPGLAEHSGRYAIAVNRFVALGYAVYGIDHIGHGRSQGPRLHVDNFTDYLHPLVSCCAIIRSRHPGKPLFLIGHSMGGLIGILYLSLRPGDFTGVVLSGPALKMPNTVSPAAVFMGRVLSVLIPVAGVARIDAQGISRDPAVVESYIADPLICRGKITARLGAEMLVAMTSVGPAAARITLPILIVQGGADRIVDPAGARMFYDQVSSRDKKLIVYEGLYHEVFNEPEQDRVLTDVEAWLEEHLPPGD